MRQQSHGLPVNSLNEWVIFRKSECGQRAGIWAMMCPALEAFCLMTRRWFVTVLCGRRTKAP
ncbi:hypothetical protein S506_004711 [Salmonella enterica subsp. enterica serovar Oranienburg]|nr:hypothetical protein [Salmonella enterica]EDV3389724.1 hypothetical protein [Salmonella enterica subsp. enterica serovar Oranienburg]